MISLNGFQMGVLLVLGPVSISMFVRALTKGQRSTLMLSLASLLACFFVAVPEWTQKIARILGIGRGADLVLYGAVFAVLGVYALFLAQARKQRMQITELVRALALRDMEHGSAPSDG